MTDLHTLNLPEGVRLCGWTFGNVRSCHEWIIHVHAPDGVHSVEWLATIMPELDREALAQEAENIEASF